MSEIRALLLTDVVDSTKLAEKLGDKAMAEIWLQHDRVARDLLPTWRGREIDKTDGMLLLFENAQDAVAYAHAYHQGLTHLSVALKARAGLHVGPVILRENHADDVARGAKPLEVEGLAKPTAARVMGLARGGQTLITPEARESLGVSDWSLQSHGHWVMKGIAEPVELFEVGADAALFAAPPDGDKVYRVVRHGERWVPVKQVPNNLPEQLTSFVGRERELGDIKQRLSQTRLLTLLGMGGLGKTRLSLQAADEMRAEFPDGLWFLDLAPLRDPALVLSEAAQAMGVREEPGQPLLQTLSAHLKTRRVLIVMDNCEHLLKPCAQLAFAILKAAPNVRILASSRESLRVPGEQSYPILPLPVPSRNDSYASLAASTAVRLFVERVQQHQLDFVLSQELAPDVGELVGRLEGIPLALELAAARVRMFSVAEINLRLADRYKELVDGDFVLEERQQTLRALVDWSYDMLPAAEKVLLNRLAPMRGGFDAEAAQAVCGSTAPLLGEDTEALLTLLLEKSLLSLVKEDSGRRYKMLETIRDYAVEKLGASGESLQIGAAHCMYFFEFSKLGRNGMRGPQQGEWLARLETDHDNLRAAISLAQSDAGVVDPVVSVKLAVALQGFWILCGHATEGRAALLTMLKLPAVLAADRVHAFALYVGTTLAWSQSDHAVALDQLATCLTLRRHLGNTEETAAALSTIALARLNSGDAAGARRAGMEALQLLRDCGYRVGEASVLLQLGQIEVYLGSAPQAEVHLRAALSLARDIDHMETEAEAELTLAQLALEADDFALAGQGLARSLLICQNAGDRRGVANALWWMGKTDLSSGHQDLALSRFAEALTAFNAFDMREQLLGCLEDHGDLALRLGRSSMAVGLVAAAQTLREKARLPRSTGGELHWSTLLEQLRLAYPDTADFADQWAIGQHWNTAEALRQARILTAVQ